MILSDMHQAINGERFATFHTIEGEKPSRTALETVSDSDVAIVLHF